MFPSTNDFLSNVSLKTNSFTDFVTPSQAVYLICKNTVVVKIGNAVHDLH